MKNTNFSCRISTFVLSFLIFSVQLNPVKAQADFEKQITILAADIASKISQSGKSKLAISDFADNNGKMTELGQAIAEELTVNLISVGGLQIMERNHLRSILKEHQLASSGLIDPETAKELGKLKMVDAIIVGTLTPFGDNLRLSVKVLDTETGLGIAASKGEIARTEAINKLFDSEVGTGQDSRKISSKTETIPNQNSPSGLKYSNVKITDCEVKNIGHFCFQNKFQEKVVVRLEKPKDYTRYEITLSPDESQCFYNWEEGSYEYSVRKFEKQQYALDGLQLKQGFVYIEACKMITFEIK